MVLMCRQSQIEYSPFVGLILTTRIFVSALYLKSDSGLIFILEIIQAARVQERLSVLAAPRRKEQYLPGSACDTQIALFVSMVR